MIGPWVESASLTECRRACGTPLISLQLGGHVQQAPT